MSPTFYRSNLTVGALLFSVSLPTLITTTSAPMKADAAIPTLRFQRGVQEAIAPDWSKLSFANLPAPSSGGSFLERRWQVNQPLHQFMTLGDFAETFRLQDLTLYPLLLNSRRSPKDVKLSELTLLQSQTIADLVRAIPALGQRPVSEVPPIAALLKLVKPNEQMSEQTPVQILAEDPGWNTLRLGAVNLSSYTLNDLPGLISTPLQNFFNWEQTGIGDVPGLKDLPWSQFPAPPVDGGAIGTTQPTLPKSAKPMSAASLQSISGSDLEGYAVPCTGQCKAVTFVDPPILMDKGWFSANQWVKGGTGDVLSNLTVEPTGRSVFTPAFKVVVTEVSATDVKTSLFFRLCQKSACSPFQVGSVPFLNYHLGEGMFIGTIDTLSSSRSDSPPKEPNPLELPTDSFSTVPRRLIFFLTQVADHMKDLFRRSTPVAG